MATHIPWFSASLRRKLVHISIFTIGTPIVGFGSLYLWTRGCTFEPFGPKTSLLFQHPVLKAINPRNNPSTHDCCVRAVPFSKIRSELLDDARRGGSRMTEAFSAGIWGGYGYDIQRNILHLTKDESNSSDLWTKKELLSSTYDLGTAVTNYFAVLERTPSRLIFRGCLSPNQTPMTPQEQDTLIELSAVVNEGKQVVEFRMSCIAFDGIDSTAREDPFGGFPGLMHRLYAKLLVESAVGNCIQ
ncbi:hypothetical protein ACLOAV_001854 [Pseudogymnoascus australis]